MHAESLTVPGSIRILDLMAAIVRRAFPSALLVCALAMGALFAFAAAPLDAQTRAWEFSSYEGAMTNSGRDMGSMSQSTFNTAQQRKQKYLDEIQSMLTRNFGEADPE